MPLSSKHITSFTARKSRWLIVLAILICSVNLLAQDNKPINNKRQINEMRAKSVKKKEKASTKDIAGKRLRTRNKNSTADRAIYSNPSPYADKKRTGGDRKVKGSSPRIRSRTAETARENVYPNSGSFTNGSRSNSSETGNIQKSKYTRSGKLSASQKMKFGTARSNTPKSRTRSAESARSNVYPQKGPFVNRSSYSSKTRSITSRTSRSGKISTRPSFSTRYTNRSYSKSTSAEYSRTRQFKQNGSFVNRTSKTSERAYRVQPGTTRTGKLSAGPVPPGKKKRATTPRTASQPFVTKPKKDVYWGKFSKGEKPFTTDISGNPLRRKNYRTPPNEVVHSKNPYEGRKKSKGDKAYAGTFKSGHVSESRKTERAWKGDISGSPIRKRSTRPGETAGERVWSPNMATGFKARLMRGDWGSRKGIKPDKGGGGSISASRKYRSNAPLRTTAGSISETKSYQSNKAFRGRGIPLSVSSKTRDNKFRPNGGGSISASAKYRNNAPLRATAGSISESGKYRTNQPFRGRGLPLSVSNKTRDNKFRPNGGGSISASAKYRSNAPLRTTAGSISETGNYRTNQAFRGRGIPLSASGKARDNKFRQNGGGSISATGKYRSNKPLQTTAGSISESGSYRSNAPFRGRGIPLSVSGKKKLYDNKPKGNMSVSGKMWNNNGKPIEVRRPKGEEALQVGYAGFIKQSFWKRAYEQNPNAHKEALKKQKPYNTVYMADGLQVSVKAKEANTKTHAAKGSLPGVKPSKATVKASEYDRSMKMYWSYKRNPSSADEARKTIAPSKSFERASSFQGRTRMTRNYVHNPNSDREALKVIAPGRAYARITDYQGNIKMNKFNDRKHFPDAKFAHSKKNNVKEERTIGMDVKLLWSRIFKKNEIQPAAVKEKPTRPRYDKRERELWKDLYD